MGISNSYYVDQTGGNDASDGRSPDTAWKTLSKVNESPISGRLLFKRGETWTSTDQYALVLNASNLVVGAYGTGNDPIIVGSSSVAEAFCVHAAGDNITISDLKLTTAKKGGVKMAGLNVMVHDCEITGCGAGCQVEGANARIYNNTIHHLTIVLNTPSPTNDDYGAVGVWLYEGSDGTRIYNNDFRYCLAPTIDFGLDGGAVEVYGSVSNVRVYNNFAYQCLGFTEFGAPPDSGDIVSDFLVYNNVVSECPWLGLFNTEGSINAIIVDGVQYLNNTVTSAAAHVLSFSTTAAPAGTDLILRNNIFNGFADLSYNGNGDLYTHEYNIYTGAGGATLGTGEIINTDPRLAAAAFVDMTFDAGYAWEANGNYPGDQGLDSISAAKFELNANAALNGSVYGVRVTINGTTQFNGTKNTVLPDDVRELWIEFWFDPNSMVMSPGDFFLLTAGVLGGAPWQVWGITIDAWDSPYRAYLSAMQDGGTAVTNTRTLTDAPHRIRLHLVRASTAIAADGTATWYFDNMTTPVVSMTTIDNYDIFPNMLSLQFGQLYSETFAAAGGVYFMDEYRASISPTLGTNIADDFQLLGGSPCIGAGVDVGLTTDYAGAEMNTPPDIGAYRYP